jgi:hypothetical protein
MATTYFTRTPSSGAATQKATFSFWVKKTNITGTPNLFRMYTNSTQYVRIRFESSNKISFIIINSDSYVVQLISTQVFRDTSAWYNIVCNMDTTQATASDRAKIYINGERITAYDTAVYPPTQDANIIVTPSGTANVIGTQIGDSASYFEGCMSHINFTDGYVYQASEFGETDSTTGEWKIKTSPSVTYGTNGFFILKDGNSVTDQSGEGNNFAVTAGTLTNTEDCPSNVFATLNPLVQGTSTNARTFSNGNNTIVLGRDSSAISSIGVNSGKYYCEIKCVADAANPVIGIAKDGSPATVNPWGGSNLVGVDEYGYVNDGQKKGNAGSFTSYGSTWTTGDIISIAYNATLGAVWFGKNGTWQNSATDAQIAAGTTTYAAFTGLSGTFFMGCCDAATPTGDTFSTNFGNGYFGTTAVSSAGTNASAIGIFEYDVPAGFTALSTKGLNL